MMARRFVLSLGVMAAFMGLCAGNARAQEVKAHKGLLDIQEVVSANGIRAWLVEDHNIPVIALSFAFKDAGAAQDPADKQGLARMVSNTMDEGAGELNSQAFQKELQDLSISLSFNASRDSFGGGVKTLTKNKDRAFELLELALTKPRFDQEAIERMRQSNQSRIRTSISDPDWIAARLMNDIAFAGHPYALNSGGTLTSLEAISADDLRTFHATKLGRNNLVVSVAGDISAQELKTLLDDVFGGLPEVTLPAVADFQIKNTGSLHLHKKDIPQSVVEIMLPGINRMDPDYQIAQVMNFVLGSSGFGSRLTEEIREKRGLTYGIYSSFQGFTHLDAMSVSTSTKNESVGEMLSLIRSVFEKLRDEPISEEELSDAKAYLIGSLPLALTSTEKISDLLLSLQVDDLPIDYLDQREAKIRATSIEDVQRVAQRLLKPDDFLSVIVGQPEGLSGANIIETLPNVE